MRELNYENISSIIEEELGDKEDLVYLVNNIMFFINTEGDSTRHIRRLLEQIKNKGRKYRPVRRVLRRVLVLYENQEQTR